MRIWMVCLVWVGMAGFIAPSSVHADVATTRQTQVNAAVDRAVGIMQWQVEQMPLGPSLTVGQLLDAVGGHDQLNAVLRRSQLIGGPRWMPDGQCEVRLEIEASNVARIISAVAAAKPKACPIPQDELQRQLAQWQGLKFISEGANHEPPTTRPTVPPEPVPASRPTTIPSAPFVVQLPEQPPEWVGRTINVTGQAAAEESSLQTFRTAQLAARQSLLVQIQALPLTQNMSLAQAARHDPAVEQAIDAGLTQSQTDRVVFNEDGSVQIEAHLELWRLWRLLTHTSEP